MVAKKDEKKKKQGLKPYAKLVSDVISLKKTVKKQQETASEQQKCIKEKDQRISVMENRWRIFKNIVMAGSYLFVIGLIIAGFVLFVYSDYGLFTLSMTILGIQFTIYGIVFVMMILLDWMLGDLDKEGELYTIVRFTFWLSLLIDILIICGLALIHQEAILEWL
jgi:hypothetical protein